MYRSLTSDILDSLIAPLIFSHFTRDFCPSKISTLSMMLDVLNGAHGYTIYKHSKQTRGWDLFLRKKISILMSYSDSLPSYVVA